MNSLKEEAQPCLQKHVHSLSLHPSLPVVLQNNYVLHASVDLNETVSHV